MQAANPKVSSHAPSAPSFRSGVEGTVQAASAWAHPSFCGLRLKSFTWLAAVALAGAVLLVYSNLRSSADADRRTLGPDSGFGLTRGSFEVAVATTGLIQPFEVVDVGAQVSGQLSTLQVKLGDRETASWHHPSVATRSARVTVGPELRGITITPPSV
jgi:hypothetical protein